MDGLHRLRPSSEIAEGQTPGLLGRDASGPVRFDLTFEMVAELLGDLAFNLATTEKSTKPRDETSDHRPSRRMRRMDSANSSHVSVSWFSRFRPAGVIV